MRKVSVLFGVFLFLVISCQAHSDCFRKIDAINKNALSLEAQCLEIRALAETLVAGGCCGGSGECACAPTPIEGTGTIQLLTPGTYCLNADLATSEIEAGDNVVIDLNGHTIRNIFGEIDANFTVKNGIVLTQIAVSGDGTAFVAGVKVPELVGGNLILVDVTGLQTINSNGRLFMVHCSSDITGPSSFTISAQDIVIYDSFFKDSLNVIGNVQKVQIYKSLLIAGLSAFNLTAGYFDLLIYESVVKNIFNISFAGASIHVVIEKSIFDIMYFASSEVVNSEGLVSRSQMGNVECVHCKGLTFSDCMVGGSVKFTSCENCVCSNVSSQSSGECFSVNPFTPAASVGSIIFRDCFATTQGTAPVLAGYSFEGTCTAVNVLSCTAKGCPNGFVITSPEDAFSGVIKDCAVDGCTTGTSYALTNVQNNLYAYGNTAISVGGVPTTNYDANALSAFNPLATALTAIETDTVTSWRNISFELP